MPVAARQHPPEPSTAPDPATIKAGIADAGPPTRPPRCGDDQAKISASAFGTAVPRVTEPRFEILAISTQMSFLGRDGLVLSLPSTAAGVNRHSAELRCYRTNTGSTFW